MKEIVSKPSVLKVKQPNEFTMARYDMGRTEKMIFYYAIKGIQEKVGSKADELNGMGIEEMINLDRSLFGDITLKIPVAHMKAFNSETGNETNTTKIWQAAISLMSKKFEVKAESWLAVNFLSSVVYSPKTGILTIDISHKLVPFILRAINNYTLYSFITAITFKRVYSQRFYEFCHRWRSTGYWRITPEDLKDMLKIEPEKYKNWNDFKKYVIEPSEKELKEDSDVWFTYKETKQGRKVLLLEFSIHVKAKEISPIERDRIKNTTAWRYTLRQLNHYLNDVKFKDRVALELLADESKLLRLAERIERLDDDIASGKMVKSNVGGLLRSILKADYGIL